MPIRVAHLISKQQLYGVERYAINLMAALKEQGVECLAICSGKSDVTEMAASLDLPVAIVAMRSYRNLSASWKILKVCRDHGIDLLHAHLGIDSMFGVASALIGRLPIVQSVHLEQPQYMKAPPPLAGAWRLLQCLKGRFVSRFLAVSEEVALLLNKREGVPLDKVAVIVPGVRELALPSPEQRQMARQQLGVEKATVILTVARLEPEKGMPILIEAARQVVQDHPCAKFWIAGSGSQCAALGQQIKESGLNAQVELLGYRDNILAFLYAADFCVLPSLRESFGLAAAEAMMAGLPVIGTEGTGLAKVIGNRATGLLVRPGDARELAQAITYLITNPDVRRAIGEQARRRAQQHFSLRRMAGEVAALYRDVLEGLAEKRT